MAKQISQEEFLKRAKLKHGDLYDYTYSSYTGADNYVEIICKVHGKFQQKAKYHLKGQGCKKCAIQKSKNELTASLDDVLTKFHKIHGDLYDYSKMKYTGILYPIDIVCKIHGTFSQKPRDHLQGSGCNQCFIDRCSYDLEMVKKIGLEKFGPKFQYIELFENENGKHLRLSCPDHGEFTQYMANHLQGHDCNLCAAQERGKIIAKTTEWFIEKATEKHNGRFLYDKIKYETTHKNVTITCKLHGDFSMQPANHLQGQICPKCVIGGRYTEEFFKNNPEMKNIKGTLYLLMFESENEKFWKIGITKRSVATRWSASKGYHITPIFTLEKSLYEVYLIEQKLLKDFCYRRRYTPLKTIGGDKECFIPKESDQPNWLESLIETIHSFST